ncbi:MAG: glutamine-hydrolyzing GMP synthase [Candidatus Doudnabacteria bacterium RIFCSPHIGHO2_02_FULL_42_25]|uniref:GMP synthase [glutamine-hydrolyzing] n=1 Tax=Candidatus Doudnabacteria bacterium RIFCSPHIGHO2_01_FULL_41_86 TaxID=1817821 RepID=A0A1F5N7L3_9BACT|nr:MAG: glutamine-hydrolyzing GMP synthase [Candidatus Doudnabacteria bacterium RIFCSPHIGHO2_01_FULL_41_86]OGE75670.1 MAG: glutamine-hydrolyzing GMP synthase [Candidatus Doudnabacteria bacterium RIFCSPHIGHO2_01_43_10]OGE85682.1 MAG: glutamine-hydrolyzing GMP synthase [Candidatus Doudnabacteria bacterium RIFCSPHIGHO2_12_FULL_42_22]OGE87177.1 MAG: glutamine-hydrolyzing GMP synthase [Candidatus Doudnabacteria bacterium RIFCSPHIGHO2_02_FULL_42_25]OGE92015.1 MAG: glutamine-hydrolyzing GMP synthase [
MDKIIVLDFGGQYCHLIARRIRDFGVLAEVTESSITPAEIRKDPLIKGIILSGGARSVYEKNPPKFNKRILDLEIPVFGICYGHQLIAHKLGGIVRSGKSGEYGLMDLEIRKRDKLLTSLNKKLKVWMNHRDIVIKLPRGFVPTTHTKNSPIASYSNEKLRIFGVQFHPEVSHTQKGDKILENFIFKICRSKPQRSDKNIISQLIKETKVAIGSSKAIIGLSGGIDSSVAAMIVSKAIGKRLTAVYVDTGLMRANETQYIKKAFRNKGLNLKIVNASELFFKGLKGVTSPEQKRKIIGKLFIDVFYREAKKSNADYLIQGTIYSDRIESGLTKHSSNIKSHHNVGGLPKDLKLKLHEPLKDLYKDEVRKISRILKLPNEITSRQVFPGPGLAVRIIGEVNKESALIVRKAQVIIEEELINTKYWKQIWMSFGVVLPIKSVGIQGDERSYKFPLVLRIVESKDGMTANFSKLPYEILEKISTRITNEIKEVNRVVYDITNKPPGTMEWE